MWKFSTMIKKQIPCCRIISQIGLCNLICLAQYHIHLLVYIWSMLQNQVSLHINYRISIESWWLCHSKCNLFYPTASPRNWVTNYKLIDANDQMFSGHYGHYSIIYWNIMGQFLSWSIMDCSYHLSHSVNLLTKLMYGCLFLFICR